MMHRYLIKIILLLSLLVPYKPYIHAETTKKGYTKKLKDEKYKKSKYKKRKKRSSKKYKKYKKRKTKKRISKKYKKRKKISKKKRRKPRRRKPKRRRKKITLYQTEPAIYNDIKKMFVSPEEYDEDWHRKKKKPKKGALTRDFSTFGAQVKSVMKKHHFTIGTIPYSIQGVPIIYTSKATGFNIGAKVSLYDLKHKDPYRYSFSLQLWASDRGRKNHEIKLDIPKFFSKYWHLKITYIYPEVIDKKFFGIGNDSIFNKALTNPKDSAFISRTYYQYKYTYPRFSFDIKYKIPRSKLSVYSGIGLDKASIKPHNYNTTSKIYMEQPYGYSGGNTNYLKGGLMYDTRDYPLNPSKGIVLAGTFTNHGKYIRSDFSYSNINLAYMGFFSFLKYFVLAHRVMIDQMWGDLPFFALAGFKSYENYEGLGGSQFLRGFPSYRYTDNLKMIHQLELRTKFYNGRVFGQHLKIDFLPYWDMGRVWDRHKKFKLDKFHHSFGNEFRFIWNKNFIMSFTFGISRDAFETYLTFGESFK